MAKNKTKTKRNEKGKSSSKRQTKQYLLTSIGCNLLVAIAIIAGLFIAEPIKQFDLKVGDIATESITASRDIEDEYTTNLNIQAAKDSVQDIYKVDDSVTIVVNKNIKDGIDYCSLIAEAAEPYFQSWKDRMIESYPKPDDPDPLWSETSEEYKEYERKLAEYNAHYNYYFNLKFDDIISEGKEQLFSEIFNMSYWSDLLKQTDSFFNYDNMQTITKASSSDIKIIKNNLKEAVSQKMSDGIRQNEISETIDVILNSMHALGLSNDIEPVVKVILREIKENEFFNEEQTNAAKEIAASNVETVYYKKGQTIVSAGQPITEAQYMLIDSLGLLVSGGDDYSNYIGMSVAVILMCLINFILSAAHKKFFAYNSKNCIMTSILIIISSYAYLFLRLQNEYIVTAMLAVMMIGMLVDGKSALIAGIETSVFAGLYSGASFPVMLVSFIGSVVCACLVKRTSTGRSKIILIGVLSSIFSIAAATAMEYYQTAYFATLPINAFWIMLGGIGSSVLTIGLLTVFENVFGATTPIRLLELSNQSQPVLKRLQLEATGTYYHSIMVGNMAETAANDIGADGLLARVGAYYHDIGKLKDPQMFKENQQDDYNPHIHLPPERSAQVIIAHVKDGIALAEQNRVPKILFPFIEEHHGSTITTYFYYNACEKYGKENVHIDDFKYSGKTPSSKECAIVMLADTVEAAVRAMKDHSHEALKATIDELVDGKISMHQLDNCPITFKEITQIKQSFFRLLAGVYHKRIEYPKLRADEEEAVEESNEK